MIANLEGNGRGEQEADVEFTGWFDGLEAKILG